MLLLDFTIWVQILNIKAIWKKSLSPNCIFIILSNINKEWDTIIPDPQNRTHSAEESMSTLHVLGILLKIVSYLGLERMSINSQSPPNCFI